MDIDKLPPGSNPPHEINVLIEVPLRSDPIKYEYDKENGFIFVDRYLYTAMFYPCNYGFIPQHAVLGWRSGRRDGDRADAGGAGCDPARTADRRADDGGRGRAGREDPGRAHRQDHPGPPQRPVLQGRSADRPRPDHPFLRALQGPGAQQVGEGAGLGGRRRGAAADPRRHRPRQRPIGLRPRFRTRPWARPGPVL